MNLDKDLLTILCCPETKQSLSIADEALVKRLNEAVTKGTLLNKARKKVTEPLSGGLIRSDGRVVYPVRENIPVMLIEEGIPLAE